MSDPQRDNHGKYNAIRQAVKVAILRGTTEWGEVEWILKVSHIATMRLMDDAEVLTFADLAARIWSDRREE